MLKPISTDDVLSKKIRLLMISHQLKIDQLNFPDLYTSVPDLYTSEPCFSLTRTLRHLTLYIFYIIKINTMYPISNDTRVSLDYMVFISIMRTLCNVRCLCLNPFFCIVFFFIVYMTLHVPRKSYLRNLWYAGIISYDTFLVNVGGYLITNKMFLYLYLESFSKRSEHDTNSYNRYM